MLDTLVDYNDLQNAPFLNKKLRQSISKVMAETKEKEHNIIPDDNNVTMDTFCQSPITTNTQRENADTIFTSERIITSDILSETLKGLTLYSTINESSYYNSDKDDAERYTKSDPLVDTHTGDGNKRKVTDTDTNNRNSPQKILINQTIPVIILPINPPIMDGVEAGRGAVNAV